MRCWHCCLGMLDPVLRPQEPGLEQEQLAWRPLVSVLPGTVNTLLLQTLYSLYRPGPDPPKDLMVQVSGKKCNFAQLGSNALQGQVSLAGVQGGNQMPEGLIHVFSREDEDSFASWAGGFPPQAPVYHL